VGGDAPGMSCGHNTSKLGFCSHTLWPPSSMTKSYCTAGGQRGGAGQEGKAGEEEVRVRARCRGAVRVSWQCLYLAPARCHHLPHELLVACRAGEGIWHGASTARCARRLTPVPHNRTCEGNVKTRWEVKRGRRTGNTSKPRAHLGCPCIRPRRCPGAASQSLSRTAAPGKRTGR